MGAWSQLGWPWSQLGGPWSQLGSPETAGRPGGGWRKKRTEHSYYMLVPEVIVPYGTAAQKVMRRGYAGQKMGIFGVNVAQWVCIQLLCQREAREALWIPKLNRPDRGTV